MQTIPDSDRQLTTDLQVLLDQLATLRRGLYTRRLGCSCDERCLCALHAGVAQNLTEAADSLARAIGYAQSEG